MKLQVLGIGLGKTAIHAVGFGRLFLVGLVEGGLKLFKRTEVSNDGLLGSNSLSMGFTKPDYRKETGLVL
jgi:hypothetical protein